MGNLETFMSRFGTEPTEDYIEKPNALSSFTERFCGKSESYWFFDHTVEIRFDPIEHEYFLVDPVLGNLTLLLNVSTVAHIVDRSFALVPWSSKVCIEKLLRTVPVVDGRVNLSIEDFTKLCLEAKSAHKEILDTAGDLGHQAHSWIETEIKCKISGIVNVVAIPEDERVKSCCLAALYWMDKHAVRWLETERKVYSKKHNVCGTLDGLAYVSSCLDPTCCAVAFKDHLSLIDWKSANQLYTEFLYQTAMYAEMVAEEFPEKKVVDRWVIQLSKEDAKFNSWYLPPETFEEDLNGFLACLSLKRIVNSVEERMKAQKRSTKEAKRLVATAAKELEVAADKVRKAEAKAEAKRLKQLEKESK